MNTDSIILPVVILLGGFVLIWYLRQRQTPVAPVPTSLPGNVVTSSNPYVAGAQIVYTALTNPNKIQHSFGLAGTDGWGAGIFKSGSYPNLPDDQKLYYLLATSAQQAQDDGDHGCPSGGCSPATPVQPWAFFIAKTIMPAIADGNCCDFDAAVPLARGHGTMKYLGNYQVSFSQNGVQRTANMRRISPKGYTEPYKTWFARIGVSVPEDIANRIGSA